MKNFGNTTNVVVVVGGATCRMNIDGPGALEEAEKYAEIVAKHERPSHKKTYSKRDVIVRLAKLSASSGRMPQDRKMGPASQALLPGFLLVLFVHVLRSSGNILVVFREKRGV
jgi:hypothetical protein